MKKIIIIIFTILMIHNCGNSPTSTPSSFDENNQKPVFISKDTIEIKRSKIDSFYFIISVEDKSDIEYFITGVDAELFSVDTISGKLNIKNSNFLKDRSIFKIIAIAMDTVGHRESQKITITIIEDSNNSKTPDTNEDSNKSNIPENSSLINKRFTRDDTEEIVIDSEKKLMWQDDVEAKSTSKPWITKENYNICKDNKVSPSCNDSSGNTAITYCTNLTLGEYRNWRLPTKNELKTIIDKSRTDFALIQNPFQNIYPNTEYWTSTINEPYDLDVAWGIDFSKDQFHFWIWKHDYYMVRCVRNL